MLAQCVGGGADDYQDNGDLPAETLNLDFDRICQELGSAVSHAHPKRIRESAAQEMQRRMDA